MAGNPCNIIPDQEIVLEGGAKLVPAPEAADAGKVLGVLNSSGSIGWVVDQGGTLVQQQSNWAETNDQSVSFIQNKPDLSVYATTSAMNTALGGKQDVINDLSDIRAGAALGATAAQPSDLPSSDELVPSATSVDAGKVLSVDNQGSPAWITPSGGTTYSAGDGIDIGANNAISAKVDGTTIGIDASTNEIELLATIPTKTSDLQNDSGFITSSDIPAQVNADWNSSSGASEILHKPDLSIYAQSANLATVATTGDYDDLVNKPSIPAAQVNSDWNSNSGVSQILNKPSLATVATTGDYNDLSNKPSIPAAQVNADWNSSSGVSEILNKPSLATVATTGAYSDLTGTPTIPSVDQTYNASSTNAQSGTAVAGALATVNQVPASTSSDENKVLTVNSSGTPIWATAQGGGGTVDQTYNASSTNAQSGTAVAGALATVNQVPASTSSDEDKVLTVNSSGTPVWAASSVPASKPLVAGSNITITENTNDVTIAATAPTVDQTYNASSTNAQSGVAVASAISGINAVPASTSADQDKVLTVNSSGTPVWATAQGGGGSGGDSEFPYNPGYLNYGADTMVVRFGDTSYDPTAAASASNFVSITALSEPGVYEYELIQSSGTLNWSFANEWNNFSANPVDVLYYNCSDPSNQYYRRLFSGCTGLRSIWNFRGTYSNLESWCQGCTNLQIFSSNSKDKYDADVARGAVSFFETYEYAIYLQGDGTATNMFYGCESLRRADTILYFDEVYSGGNAYNICYGLKSLEVGPSIGGCLSNIRNAFADCQKMIRLFSSEDFPVIVSMCPEIFSAPTVDTSMDSAFYHCFALQDVSGLILDNCAVSNLSSTFNGCGGLPELNCILYLSSNGCNASRAFQTCSSLKTIPCIDYKAISDASFMFYEDHSLLDVTELNGLAQRCTNVNYLLTRAYNVVKGVDTLYSALSSSQTITSHDGTFDETGAYAWNDQLSQIPSSWGGTGA